MGVILSDPLLIESQELEALSLSRQLGECLARIPTEHLVVTREIVADAMVSSFVTARTHVQLYN